MQTTDLQYSHNILLNTVLMITTLHMGTIVELNSKLNMKLNMNSKMDINMDYPSGERYQKFQDYEIHPRHMMNNLSRFYLECTAFTTDVSMNETGRILRQPKTQHQGFSSLAKCVSTVVPLINPRIKKKEIVDAFDPSRSGILYELHDAYYTICYPNELTSGSKIREGWLQKKYAGNYLRLEWCSLPKQQFGEPGVWGVGMAEGPSDLWHRHNETIQHLRHVCVDEAKKQAMIWFREFLVTKKYPAKEYIAEALGALFNAATSKVWKSLESRAAVKVAEAQVAFNEFIVYDAKVGKLQEELAQKTT